MRSKIFLLMLILYFPLAAQEKPGLIEPNREEISNYTALGDAIAKKLLVSLKSELVKGMKEGGAVNALQICNVKAIPLTAELISSSNNVVGIKRVSTKYRNPGNRPDENDSIALKYLSDPNDSTGEKYVQKYFKDGKPYFNYYQSIKVGSFCTTCHGDESKMDGEIVKTIRKLYPDDKATGYKTGDFRGAIKIIFSEK